MTIKVTYYDDNEKTFNNFDEITDYQSVKIINCFGCNLKELPSLPKALQELRCEHNQLVSLPIVPNSLQILYCGNNQLTSLPTLPQVLQILSCYDNQLTFLPTLSQVLQILYCSFNQLTTLPTLPQELQELSCGNNQLTQLPVSLLFCRNLTLFNYSDNPLDLTPQQINFIQRIQQRNTQIDQHGYFNDTQNVHNTALQKSLMTSIHNLMSH